MTELQKKSEAPTWLKKFSREITVACGKCATKERCPHERINKGWGCAMFKPKKEDVL